MQKYIAALVALLMLVACGQSSETGLPLWISISSSPWDAGVGEQIEFKAYLNSNDQAYAVSWDFGDGTHITGGSDAATHSYQSAGDYTVKATLTVGGRTAYTDRQVSVQATPSLRSWIYIERTDAITDANTSYIKTGGSSLSLYIRCSSSASGVDVYVSQDRHLGIQNSYSVTYRVDARDPVTAGWNASADYQAAFARAANVPELFQELAAGDEVIFRIGAFDGTRTYRAIGIDGFRPALDKLGCYTGPALPSGPAAGR